MCRGGRLLADFVVGSETQPQGLPAVVAECLTQTCDDRWVIWAYKVALMEGKEFRALTGASYPADARANCARGFGHSAPQPACSCGFHAVSERQALRGFGLGALDGPTSLCVALSGRVLAFDWLANQVLFRAERQTVARIERQSITVERPRDDPSGRAVRVAPSGPLDAGPARLALPTKAPSRVTLDDDAGYCAFGQRARVGDLAIALAPV